MYTVYITSGLLGVLRRTLFSKCSIKMFAITKDIEEIYRRTHSRSMNLFAELIVIGEVVIVRQCSIEGMMLLETSCVRS